MEEAPWVLKYSAGARGPCAWRQVRHCCPRRRNSRSAPRCVPAALDPARSIIVTRLIAPGGNGVGSMFPPGCSDRNPAPADGEGDCL